MQAPHDEYWQCVNERARILSLQLQSQRLQCQVDAALSAYGRESPTAILSGRIASGFMGRQLTADLAQQQVLQQLRDRVTSSTSASGSSRSGPVVQVLGKARPRAHAAVAQVGTSL